MKRMQWLASSIARWFDDAAFCTEIAGAFCVRFSDVANRDGGIPRAIEIATHVVNSYAEHSDRWPRFAPPEREEIAVALAARWIEIVADELADTINLELELAEMPSIACCGIEWRLALAARCGRCNAPLSRGDA